MEGLRSSDAPYSPYSVLVRSTPYSWRFLMGSGHGPPILAHDDRWYSSWSGAWLRCGDAWLILPINVGRKRLTAKKKKKKSCLAIATTCHRQVTILTWQHATCQIIKRVFICTILALYVFHSRWIPPRGTSPARHEKKRSGSTCRCDSLNSPIGGRNLDGDFSPLPGLPPPPRPPPFCHSAGGGF